MLKVLAFILLIFFLLRGLGSLIRLFLGGGASARPNQQFYRPRSKRPAGGNVDVEFESKRQRKKSGGYRGGEYVDYEDVD